MQLADQVICDYKVSNGLIAQTCVDFLVMSGDVGGFQAKIKEKYYEAIFVHCYSHALNLVLQQPVDNVKECAKSSINYLK